MALDQKIQLCPRRAGSFVCSPSLVRFHRDCQLFRWFAWLVVLQKRVFLSVFDVLLKVFLEQRREADIFLLLLTRWLEILSRKGCIPTFADNSCQTCQNHHHLFLSTVFVMIDWLNFWTATPLLNCKHNSGGGGRSGMQEFHLFNNLLLVLFFVWNNCLVIKWTLFSPCCPAQWTQHNRRMDTTLRQVKRGYFYTDKYFSFLHLVPI